MAANNFTGGSYNLTGLLPQHWIEWDNYETRLGRYDVFDGYYHNVAYHTIMSYAESLKFTERLYKHVRGVYNPVSRLVELYVSKVYGGMLDTAEAKTGAIPIDTDNEAIREALPILWKASRWNQKKSLFVRNGAKFGDAYIKIVDDIEHGMVYMETIDPRKVRSVETDPAGRIEKAVLEYMIDVNGKLKTYKEVITPESFATFIDGVPAALNTNGRGEQVHEWRNEYGFVPLTSVMHRDVGLDYGANAWYTTMQKINELNDIASILNDGARRQVNMPLFTFGQKLNGDLGSDQSTNSLNKNDNPKKDTVSSVAFHKDSRVEAMPPVIDISATLGIISEIINEIERDMPELSLHRLRDSGNLTAPGVRSAYDDAIARIQEARGNYDGSLVEAQKMALAIGGMRGYDGYSGFNLVSLERGDLEHRVADRPVISDSLSKMDKVQLTLTAMSSHAPEPVYTEIGWSPDDIEIILNAQDASTSSFINQFGAPGDDIPDIAPEDTIVNQGASQINATDIAQAEQELMATA